MAVECRRSGPGNRSAIWPGLSPELPGQSLRRAGSLPLQRTAPRRHRSQVGPCPADGAAATPEAPTTRRFRPRAGAADPYRTAFDQRAARLVKGSGCQQRKTIGSATALGARSGEPLAAPVRSPPRPPGCRRVSGAAVRLSRRCGGACSTQAPDRARRSARHQWPASPGRG